MFSTILSLKVYFDSNKDNSLSFQRLKHSFLGVEQTQKETNCHAQCKIYRSLH